MAPESAQCDRTKVLPEVLRREVCFTVRLREREMERETVQEQEAKTERGKPGRPEGDRDRQERREAETDRAESRQADWGAQRKRSGLDRQ